MTLGKRTYWVVALVALLALAGAAVTWTSGLTSAGGGGDDDSGEVESAGVLDDGGSLLPQAAISVDDAIAAAQGAVSGKLGEIDLEHYQGKLVFNVDIGDKDVKVDASNGSVLATDTDD